MEEVWEDGGQVPNLSLLVLLLSLELCTCRSECGTKDANSECQSRDADGLHG